MSENNDISTSSSKSLLSKKEIAILNKGAVEGFRDGYLDLRSREINDSMMPELCEWLIKLDDKVKILLLSFCRITSVGASMLIDTLKTNNSSLKKLCLDHNKKIDDKCMISLGEYIKSNTSIEIILLDDTSISDAGIEILVPYLDGNTTLKRLHLNGNKGVTDKSILLLMKMIESSCIEYIGIYYTSITQKNIIYTQVASNGIKNGSTDLQLKDIGINDDDLIKICDAMEKYGIDKLKEINLMGNNITSKGASVLLDMLRECNSIVSYLNLSYNQLDDECMNQLGEYLQDNEYVEELRLRDNKITDKGIEILSEHLIRNAALKELDLNGNKGITDASVPYLMKIVNKSCIMRLTLGDTSISKKKKPEIWKALSKPIEEREIPIKSNTKSAAKIQSSSASTST